MYIHLKIFEKKMLIEHLLKLQTQSRKQILTNLSMYHNCMIISQYTINRCQSQMI